MTEDTQDQKVEKNSEEKSLIEKLLEEKRQAQLNGWSARPQFGSRNPMVNRPWFGGNWGGGRPTIRKHAARSR